MSRVDWPPVDDASDISKWFFAGPLPLVRVAVVGVLAYVALVASLRLSGKRTLSKMNAFDLIVTVALGSILASTLLSKSTALAEGVAAFLLLIGLQYVVAWCCARYGWADTLVKSTPTIVVWRGRQLEDVVRKERLSGEEVLAAVRAAGLARVEEASAVVLETNGDLTVITGDVPPDAPRRADEHVSATALVGTTNHPGDG